MICRRTIGWGVGLLYRLIGARRRAIATLRTPGLLLPIVIHAATPAEVHALLAWLARTNLLPQVRLTFDDGWLTFPDIVPVLEHFHMPATLFIAPGEVLRGRIWTAGTTLPQRQALYPLDATARDAQLRAWKLPTTRLLMDEATVRDIARHPLITLGNHTWSHLSCTHRPHAEVLAEVQRAQDCLTQWAGTPPRDFAYPFGRGTPALDAALRARGLRPHYTRQGFVTEATLGAARNMVYEGMTLSENLGRILMAWPTVGVTQ